MKRNAEAPVVKDLNNPVQFAPPVISSGVTDPIAKQYAAGIASRRKPPPGRYGTPVGGGSNPPIPRLDMPAESGLSMADQANIQRAGGPPQPAFSPPKGGIFAGATPPSDAAAPVPMSRPPQGLLPIDILPEEAKRDPEFREGHGSMYATSQPAMAYKYGVIRNGQRVPPQRLGQQRSGLRSETLQDLKTLQDLGAGRPSPNGPQTKAAEEARIAQESAASSAGAAGRFGNSPGSGPQADPVASKNVEEALKKMDDFDFNALREMMMKDIINNEEQRKIIEARLAPLEVTDLVTRGFATQRVPVIPGKFEPEFQSTSGTEDLAIKRLIMIESKGLEVSDRYLLDKFSLMSTTIGIRSINGNPLPDHRDRDGEFNEEAFWTKFNRVAKLPFHMLSVLGVNFFWFDMRVRRLFVAENLGNG